MHDRIPQDIFLHHIRGGISGNRVENDSNMKISEVCGPGYGGRITFELLRASTVGKLENQ